MKVTSLSGLIILLALLIAQAGQADSNWILWESFYDNTKLFSHLEWKARAETGSLKECSPLIRNYLVLQLNHFTKLGWTVTDFGEKLIVENKPTNGPAAKYTMSYYCYPFGFDPRKK